MCTVGPRRRHGWSSSVMRESNKGNSLWRKSSKKVSRRSVGWFPRGESNSIFVALRSPKVGLHPFFYKSVPVSRIPTRNDKDTVLDPLHKLDIFSVPGKRWFGDRSLEGFDYMENLRMGVTLPQRLRHALLSTRIERTRRDEPVSTQ